MEYVKVRECEIGRPREGRSVRTFCFHGIGDNWFDITATCIATSTDGTTTVVVVVVVNAVTTTAAAFAVVIAAATAAAAAIIISIAIAVIAVSITFMGNNKGSKAV